jgi:hypothetical protein
MEDQRANRRRFAVLTGGGLRLLQIFVIRPLVSTTRFTSVMSL